MTSTSGNEALEKAIDHAISCFKGTKDHCRKLLSIVLVTRHLFLCGKNSFMLQTFYYKPGKSGEIELWTESYIESFSEKQEHLPSTLPLWVSGGALDSLFTNTHKHSHIIINFNCLVMQQISYCFVDYNCRSTSFSTLYSLSSVFVVLGPYGPMHTICPGLHLSYWGGNKQNQQP